MAQNEPTAPLSDDPELEGTTRSGDDDGTDPPTTKTGRGIERG